MASRYDRTVYSCTIAACLVAAAGCATEDAQSSLRKITPSFMLSEQDKAERNLKDPAALHLAYGKFQEQMGQTGEARKSYESALRDDPQSVDAILGLARLDQLADNPKDAEAGFQKAIRLKPGDARALAAIGQFYASQKRWPEAFESLNAAIAAAPRETFYKHELAVAKTASGDVNAGLLLFTQLVGPEKAHYNVAYLLKQAGKTEAALQQCRVALKINPNFEPAKTMLAQIQERQVAGDTHGPARGAARPAANAGSPIQTSFGPGSSQAGFAASSVGSSNQPVSGTSQASWQPPSRAASGVLPLNGGDATFDPAPPRDAAPSRDPQGSSSTANDPWARLSTDQSWPAR
jgi:tetratricopeptide (TPR) repeat protein